MNKLSKNFTLDEMVASETAYNFKLNNKPSDEAVANMIDLVRNVLQPARDLYGKAIFVNSGYRSPEVNRAVGGSASSQHMKGQAADISAGSHLENKKVFNLIIKEKIPFDQLIDEAKYQWIHVSYNKKGNRGQILHL